MTFRALFAAIRCSVSSGATVRLLLPLLLPTFLTAADIRQFSWNAPRSEIENHEQAAVAYRDADRIAYFVDVLTNKALLLYEFVDQKLAAAAYDFEYTRKEALLTQYAELKSALIDRYGPPQRDVTVWKNPQFRDRPRDYGLAIWLGHTRCETSWETATTQIVLYLSSGSAGVNASVTYVNKAVSKELEARGPADRWAGLF